MIIHDTTSSTPYEVERKRKTYKKHWPILIQVYGQICQYCGEFATHIDHVVPVSYGGSHDFDNLVLSCAQCNLTASDKVFDSFNDKFEYIRKKRRRKGKRTICICSDCLIPYEYRVTSPSLLLCARCYDYDSGKVKWTKRELWVNWLALLNIAGYNVDAYIKLSDIVCAAYDHKVVIKKSVKIQLLSNFMVED